MSTMAARNRLYSQLLRIHLDEIRGRKPSDEEKRRRMWEIYEQCYGDLPKKRQPRNPPRREE